MDGAIAAEEQDSVGLIGSCRHADAAVGFVRLGILKRLEVVRGTSEAEDDGGAHVRERSRIHGGDTETGGSRQLGPRCEAKRSSPSSSFCLLL